MMKKLAVFISLTCLILPLSSYLFAYDEKVHSKICEEAVAPENTQLDLILKNQLGLDNGIYTIFANYGGGI